MSANLDPLRRGLADWSRRVVADAAQEGARVAQADRRVTAGRDGAAAERLGPRPADTVTPGEAFSAGSRATARLRVETWGWQWRLGGPLRPFDPHVRLAGRVVTRPDDPVLRNPAPWPRAPFLHPQDHRGCLCRTVPTKAPADRPLWRRVLTDALRRSLRAAAGRNRL